MIKSAYEIAMENTKGIEANKELVETNRLKDEGRKLVSKALEDTEFNLKAALAGFDKKSIGFVREGLIQSLLSNLVLPMDELALARNRKAGAAMTAIASDTKKISTMFGQLEHFFQEYIDERKRLVEAVEKQYGPKLRKKEEDLSKQLGRPVKINPASDPEFQSIMRQYFGQLEAKYEEVLTGAKEEIKTILAKG
jgi:3-methyladenine DNA glycosylase Tag